MNGFDPSALISAASGAGGVITAALLLIGRSERKAKDTAKVIVLQHQADCPVASTLRQEGLVRREEMLAHVDAIRGEVRNGMGELNLRLDRIFDRLAGRAS